MGTGAYGTPEEFINAIINNAINVANEMTEEVADAADKLMRENIGTYWPIPPTDPIFQITAEEPEVPEVEDVYNRYEYELERLIKLLSDELANFFAAYYPLANDAFDEATAWMVDTITNGGTGIPASIEAQIWQRARDRVLREETQIKDSITLQYAARGQSLVQGSQAKKIEQARFERFQKTGEQSTNIAIKQVEIEIENIKFAVENAIKSRDMAMRSAVDYVRAVATSPGTAAQVSEMNGDAQAKMMAATADFYRARLSRDELVLKSDLAQIGYNVDLWGKIRDTSTDADRVKVGALGQAAEAYGKAAQAALTSLNSIASTATNAFS